MPLIIIAAIIATLSWAVRDLTNKGEDSLAARILIAIGRVAAMAMVPVVWVPHKLACLMVRKDH